MDKVKPTESDLKQISPEHATNLLDIAQAEKHVWLKQAASEFGSTIAATVSGAASWSLLDRSKFGIAGKLIATAGSSAISKYLVKAGLETSFLEQENRTFSKADLAWGAVDGFVGLAAAKTEAQISEKLRTNLGYKYAGRSLGPEQALEVGSKVLESSAKERILSHAVRGTGAGFVGSLGWSSSHALYDHRANLDSAKGWTDLAKDVSFNTVIGTALGLGLSTTISSVANGKEIAGYLRSKMQSDKALTKIDVLHFNDMHSALLGKEASLPQLATRAKELSAQSTAAGRNPVLFELGDNYSGNVIAGSTKLGYVETKAVEMMKPHGTVPGNHVADVGLGNVDVDGWVANIRKLASETNREMPALASNIELPLHPGIIGKDGIYKPYRILELNSANAKDKIGLIGLVTKELEDAGEGAIKYLDAQESARNAIAELNAQGVKKVVVLSHLGRAEDIALAQNVKGISAIVGAHSHDIEPLPFWIKNMQSGADVPIAQAGSKAQWLGEMNLALRADGTADKFKSGGRLHEIHAGIEPDKQIRSYVQSEVGQVASLESRQYDVKIKDAISMHGLRGQTGEQTPLGVLISKALVEQTNAHLPELNAARQALGKPAIQPIALMLKHTGDIKEGFTPGATNHLKLSNTFLNTGTPERELNELTVARFTGAQLKGALNFGVHDLPPAAVQETSLASRLIGNTRRFFSEQAKPDFYDYTGNYIQTEGIKYSFDRSLRPGQRVLSVEVLDRQTGKYLPLDENKTYDVLTLFHPIEKWGKRGMITNNPAEPLFNDPLNWAFGRQVTEGVRNFVSAQPIPLSQVDLLAKYLSGKGTIANKQYLSPMTIRDLTPRAWEPSVRPGFYSTLPIAALNASATDRKQ